MLFGLKNGLRIEISVVSSTENRFAIFQCSALLAGDPPGNLCIQYDGRGGSTVTVLRAAHGLHDGWYQCTAYSRAGAATTRGRLAVRRPELPPQPAPPVQLNIPREKRVIEPE